MGRIRHWHDGLGEFSRQLGLALAEQAPRLRDEFGWALHFHLPRRWHGQFGDQVGYLDTHTTQRWLHLRGSRFSLWHNFHQHNRLRAPLFTRHEIETVHDLNFLRLKQGATLERYRQRQRQRLRHCDAVAAITHFVAQEVREALAPLATPLHVIHNGATDLSAAPRRAVTALEGQDFLLHVSRMAPSKNIVALLDLAAVWPERPLVLAGASSDYSGAVQRMIIERGLRNVTVLLDIDEAQKAWLYANCHGFLFPSLTEGFGLPPIEAMYFGKPVFLSRLTSLPEVGGSLAHYFDRFDGVAMRAVVEAGLLAHAAPGRPQAVIAHASGFSWTRCAAAYLGLYREILG